MSNPISGLVRDSLPVVQTEIEGQSGTSWLYYRTGKYVLECRCKSLILFIVPTEIPFQWPPLIPRLIDTGIILTHSSHFIRVLVYARDRHQTARDHAKCAMRMQVLISACTSGDDGHTLSSALPCNLDFFVHRPVFAIIVNSFILPESRFTDQPSDRCTGWCNFTQRGIVCSNNDSQE